MNKISAKRVNSQISPYSPLLSRNKGFSLIELMVSILIGFLVVGSAIAIFSSNRQAYVASENVSRIQENMRIAYELVARDIREAAGTPCAPHITTLRNAINSSTTRWWTDSSLPLRIVGFTGAQAFPDVAFGAGGAPRVAGTQAIQLLSTSNSRAEVRSHSTTGKQFISNTSAHGIATGDLVLACDYERAALFQVSSASSTSPNIAYGGAASPGNTGANIRPDNRGDFARGAVLAKWRPVRWYIGTNPQGGRSLYQSTVVNTGGALSVQNQEVAQNIQDMDIRYFFNGDYRTADAVTNWTTVSAVRLNFVMQSDQNIGTDGAAIQRNINNTIALRMRNK
jgi:type IV pilus assembly protein PilW